MMRLIILISLSLLLSCSKKGEDISKKTELEPVVTDITENQTDKKNEDTVLLKAYNKLLQTFPSDSVSIKRFYYKWLFSNRVANKSNRLNQLNDLTSSESIKRYSEVQNGLKPLLKSIVEKQTIEKQQVVRLVKLYSDYDRFSGHALLSNLISNEDNYNLVWRSFKIIAKESPKDTTYTSALISLNKNIRTNVELAEGMPSFIIKAIQNNPMGFLDMYIVRDEGTQKTFSNNIYYYESPDSTLIAIFKDISNNSNDTKYRSASTSLLTNTIGQSEL